MNELTVYNRDILTSNESYILHQVNALGVMGAGIAKEIKKDISDSDFQKYRKYVLEKYKGKDALGRVLLFKSINYSNRFYFNLIAQENVGTSQRQTDYDALKNCFLRIAKYCVKNKIKAIAIPYKMSCGLAGGDWNIVSLMIEDILLPVTNIHIYKIE